MDTQHSQISQHVVTDDKRRTDDLRNQEIAQCKERLKPAITEQCQLLDSVASFADEHRVF